MSSLKRLFQSTLPREERPVAITPTSSKRRISIHAPTRGATSSQTNSSLTFTEFQSTLPREERQTYGDTVVDTIGSFQSTLPREERLNATKCSRHCCNFNPRSHERSDRVGRDARSFIFLISIHAPTRGATFTVVNSVTGVSNFNPRSHERSDNVLAT